MPRRKYYRKVYTQSRLVFILKILGFLFLSFIFVVFVLFIFYAKDLPRPEKFTERHFVESTKIYDRSGEILLFEIYGEEKRTIVPLETIPEHLKKAVIVAEDSNFYHHFGIDLEGMARAFLINLKIGRPIYGGSTICQQLIRSTFFSTEKTIKRKIREIVLALELDRRYSKEQILEWYLNQVPFGSNCYGVEAASQTYFGKPVAEISLAEAAALAALIQAPSHLSPYGEYKDKLLERKDYILERIVKEGYLTQEEMESAQKETLDFLPLQSIKAPHFVIYIIENYLKPKYGKDLDFLKENGIKVYTTLDWELQELAEKVIKEGVEINKNYNAYNASLVAIDPKNGQILSMVGSANWYATSSYPEGCSSGIDCLFDPAVNIATYGEGRQPGSAFKPFVYAQVFKRGVPVDAILWDVKTEFNSNCSPLANLAKDQYGLKCYHPKNYDLKFRGPVTPRQALAQSINVPSVKILHLAGVEETINLAKSMGITTLNKPLSWYGLSLVLGGGEVRLLDLVSGYGVFATEGLITSPVSILKIEDSKGNIIKENKKTPKKVLETQIARLINDILSDNEDRTPMFGPRSSLYFEGYQVAAKTGTTESYKDAWTVGYTPSIVSGVWAGNNDNTPMAKKPGVMISSPIWHRFMEKALTLYPKENFVKPEKEELSEEEKPISVLEEPYHSILHYLDQENPQYSNWEEGIKQWLSSHKDF